MKQLEKKVEIAKKYYIEKTYLKAKNILMQTCADGFGCQLLTDISVGRTAEITKKVPTTKLQKKLCIIIKTSMERLLLWLTIKR